MIEHKIQSNSGLQLNLKQVPKMLKTIVNTWCKDCFIISFKLETDSNLVIEKSKKAILAYNVNLVIANQLQVTIRIKITYESLITKIRMNMY